MNDLKKIYTVSLMAAKAEANKKVRDTQNSYDLLRDKDSDYAFIIKAMLRLYIDSAEVYNNAPSEIMFDPRTILTNIK